MNLNSIQDLAIVIGLLQVVGTVIGLYVGMQLKLVRAELQLLRAELVSAEDCEKYRSAYDTKLSSQGKAISYLKGAQKSRRG